MKVLMLKSYCGDKNTCTDEFPCTKCLLRCDVLELSDHSGITYNYGSLGENKYRNRYKKG